MIINLYAILSQFLISYVLLLDAALFSKVAINVLVYED